MIEITSGKFNMHILFFDAWEFQGGVEDVGGLGVVHIGGNVERIAAPSKKIRANCSGGRLRWLRLYLGLIG